MLLKNRLSIPAKNGANSANVDAAEVAKFDQLAHDWRDPNGRFSSVLAFNQVRLGYIQQQIIDHFGDKPISILDVGCGAGLLTQPLAELGHQVVGIDASHVNVRVATHHGKGIDNLEYRHCLSAELLSENKHFDLVLNTEVLEHVPDPSQLLEECAQLVHSQGMMILATLNRTWQSFLIGIIGAEYVLKALPIGTHDWRAFVTPQELENTLKPLGFHLGRATGMSYNPLTKKWRTTASTAVNYLVSVTR
ncbi:hypothetical protein ST37_09570 [Vibrio sp. qd031]|uniref:bifunctional 2-polyprenyl-6-hydroxyphenol methylase/3-demethylubiquinol 3-O-methyltransferase UbiG n=1 Tax=Vibrio sp. qd031 TaxID=1603038 RepID=UPI000A0F6D92|nr:bifunctional 2-polyprenyl-6-hydroxyphenol methylase/3-demethylubiquinol 3-O-methyltransferase UbiG [Vibrio sp. qd031]ORT50154.1 hypothetical protein ST37_09570 [Vibrio sp. qd031]